MTDTIANTSLLPSRGILAVSGPDRFSYLQGLITQDIELLHNQAAIHAAFLTPQGKYLHDFMIVADGDRFLIDVDKTRIQDLLKRLIMYRLRSKVEIADLSGSYVVGAIWAGESPALPEGTIIYEDPRLAELGRRLILPAGQAPNFGAEALYDRHRLILGVPNGQHDFELEKSLALEGNLDALNGASFTKGCYVGQEMTTRTKHRGKVRRRLMPVTVQGPLPAADTPITTQAGKIVGAIRSGLDDHAMAVLKLEDIRIGEHYVAGDAKITPVRPHWMPAEWLVLDPEGTPT